MTNPEKYRLAGGWPLGQYTITSGTPIQLRPKSTSGKNTPSCRQIVVNVPSGNTDGVYIMLGNFAYTDTDHILAFIDKGTVESLPYSSMLVESEFDLSNVYVDGPTDDDVCQITAYS